MTKDHTPKKRRTLRSGGRGGGHRRNAGARARDQHHGREPDVAADQHRHRGRRIGRPDRAFGCPQSWTAPSCLRRTATTPINYPATINLAASRDAGIPLMRTALVTHAGEPHLIVAGYSEGTLIAEQVRRDLQATPAGSAPSDTQLTFEMIASPFAGNGGILARFPWLDIPFIIDPMGATQPTRYDTTYSRQRVRRLRGLPGVLQPVGAAQFGARHSVRASRPVLRPNRPRHRAARSRRWCPTAPVAPTRTSSI